ncbi:MAG: hypothetical protein K2P59_01535 [Acetatifactor sp.]|nr:hypothetical protein [Acetatifactor sp.]
MRGTAYRCNTILKYALLAICTPIAVFLVYYNTCYSMRQKEILFGLTILETRDSPALHLLTAVLFLFIMLTARRVKQDVCREKGLSPLLSAVMVCTMLFCFIWVTEGNFYAQNDSRYVLECMERMRNNDYSDLRPNGYLGMYRQHFGLITLFRFLFFISGSTDDIVIQFFNCLCVPVIIYAGVRILMELDAAKGSGIGYIILMIFCFPLFLYTPYVYGEIISVTAGMLFIWAALCFIKRGKAGAWAAMAASAVIGNMARGNFPILLIAFGIMALLYSVRRKNFTLILYAFFLFLSVVLADRINIACYEKISGTELDQGIPPEAWIAMGMDEYGELGYGMYNGYGPELYAYSGYDAEVTRIRAKEFIRDRVKMFLAGAGMSAKDFYKGKLLVQWNDPTLNCFMENRTFIPQPHHLVSDIVSEEGKYAGQMKELMNQYQFLFYAGFLLYCASLLLGGNIPFYRYLPLVIILGGFLFTMLWEAMSRYVFPYVIYMLPLAAMGWDFAGERLEKAVNVLGRKRTVNKDQERGE